MTEPVPIPLALKRAQEALKQGEPPRRPLRLVIETLAAIGCLGFALVAFTGMIYLIVAGVVFLGVGTALAAFSHDENAPIWVWFLYCVLGAATLAIAWPAIPIVCLVASRTRKLGAGHNHGDL